MVSIAIIVILSGTIFVPVITHVDNSADSQLYFKQPFQSLLASLTSRMRPMLKIQNYNAYTAHRFVHTGPLINKHGDDFPKFNLYFKNISTTISKNETLKSAELRFNDVIELDGLLNEDVNIFIYDILKPSDQVKEEEEEVAKVLIDFKNVNLTKLNESSFNIEAAALRWIQSPEENHGLFVDIRNRHNNTLESFKPKLQISQRFGENNRQKPEVVLYTYREVAAKNRTESKQEEHGPCGVHQAYVKFTDIQLDDWILSMAGFYLTYCKGDCYYPLGKDMNTTTHAIVQTALHNVNPAFVPKPCCVPTSLEDQFLIYFDNNNASKVGRFQSIKVTGCGCV